MLLVFTFKLYPTKDSNIGKTNAFSLKIEPYFSSLLVFFPNNNTIKKVYASVPEMLSLNPKISIRKYPIFCSWYNFFSANVSDFYRYSTANN